MRANIPLVAALLAVAGCNKKAANPASAVQTAAIARQDLIVDVEATGVIQPINAVQVRSKASGQIMKMPAELGSRVKPGDLLVQVDPRQVTNNYDQAKAALQAAQANLTVTKTQLDRAEGLAKAGVLTAPDLETAQLNYANAQSAVAAAKTNLDNAQIALEDARIESPITGVVIEKDVSLGQVISSATNNAGGGTLLLQMADLGQVMDSTLVSESDIGNVKPGQKATVKVDAYPNRAFTGTVEKIAPEATVQQSVTMFPVLIRLDNKDGALMPGMNSDVSVLVEQRTNVLTVPNDALRTPREGAQVAEALGLDPTTVTDEVKTQLARLHPGAGRASPNATGDTAAAAGMIDPADSAAQPARARGAGGAAGAGGAGGANGRRGARGGAGANGGGNGGGGFGAQTGSVSSTSEFGAGSTRHTGLVFVAQNGTFVPRVVSLGVANYDVTEVTNGLAEGDQVALVTTAMLLQAQTARQQRIKSFTALPGMNSQQSTPRGGAGGGGRGGGGRP
ncbi:MAG TPA: efflux RND transporter periplasmic adaptor subunit [Gemmatimonadaceae bacterium]|nr:efflux RND transporter periplasmic adaptor subunit [Gemmatimonadaceae bacterium]